MRKITLLISALALTATTMFAQTWDIGSPNTEDVTATLKNGVLTISGTGEMQDWKFSSKFDPELNSPWQNESYIKEIIEVIIEEGVTNVGEQAFANCSNLTSVTLPESTTNIHDGAFYMCTYLSSINIPRGVTKIGTCAFGGCAFESIIIPCDSIGNVAFLDCLNLTSIEFSGNITNIEENAFLNCRNLILITFKNPIPLNNASAFAQFNKIQYIVPEGSEEVYLTTPIWRNFTFKVGDDLIWNIGQNRSGNSSDVFAMLDKDGILTISGTGEIRDFNDISQAWNTNSIKAVVIDPRVTTIGSLLFYNCRNLTSITIPENITKIGVLAFAGCSGLKTVNYNAINCPSEQAAFQGCDSISAFNIGEHVTSLPNATLNGLRNLQIVTSLNPTPINLDYSNSPYNSDCKLRIPRGSLTAYKYAQVWSSFKNIIEGIFKVEATVNYDKCGEVDIDIQYGLNEEATLTATAAEDFKFVNWTKNGIEVSTENPYVFSLTEDVTLIANFKPEIIQWHIGYPNKEDLTATLKDGTLTISGTGDMIDFVSFQNVPWSKFNTDIAYILIEEGITTIGSYAFSDCFNLSSSHPLIIPQSVQYIKRMAFSGYIGDLFIPSGVQIIEERAFFGCYFYSIEVDFFNPYYSSENGILYNKDKTELIQCPHGKTGNVSIAEGVTTIRNYAFESCRYLSSITIPTSVTSIGFCAFYNMSDMSNSPSIINLNPVPISLDSYVFSNDLRTLYVPLRSVSAYQNAPVWRGFNIVAIPEISSVSVIPSDNSAIVEWEHVENAAGYKIIIYHNEALTDIRYILEFGADGVLTDISTLKSESVSPSYTIENLSSETLYFYTIQTLDADNTVLAYNFGEFETVESIKTDITEAEYASSQRIAGYYSVLGIKLPQEPKSGMYIILYDTGKTEKVIKNRD